MKKKFKRILSALLVAVMLVGVAPVGEIAGLDLDWLDFSTKSSALEATGQCGENVYWTFDESTGLLTISGEGRMYDSPFQCVEEIKTVVIENGVKTIARDAFWDCTGLTSITIPDSVTSIGEYAFGDCSGLINITIPDSVEDIDQYAFDRCTSLTNITIGKGVKNIGYCAFYGCSQLTDITVDESNTVYDSRNNCNAIIETATNTIIAGCNNTVIPDGITSIGDSAFTGYTGLTNITIPDSVTSIGSYAFHGTGYYNNPDNWENGILYIGSFLISADETISGTYAIKTGTKRIAKYAFYNCHELTSITIPDGVTIIDESAFEECYSLTDVVLPDSIKDIGDGAFRGCGDLKNITIPDSVLSIGYGAFYGCSHLANITIPDSVLSIGSEAFTGTGYYDNPDNWENGILYIGSFLIDADKSISGALEIRSGTKVITDDVFSFCSKLTSITIPASVTSIEGSFLGCNSLESIAVDKSNKTFDSRNECNAIIETSSNTLVIGCKNTTIPDGVMKIGRAAFVDCVGLKSIIIPEGVTSIGIEAFSLCKNLEYVTIPDSIVNIGDRAFEDCTSLKTITIPNGVTSIGEFTFYNCYNLMSITIPSSLKVIGRYAFKDCDFITIGDVYYTGSENEWKEISIDEGNGCLTNAKIHYNYSVSHTHTLKHITVPSTCKVAGMEYDICEDCGEVFNETTLPLAAHTWGEWTMVKKPTATAEGLEKRSCSVCDEVETHTIEKIKIIKDNKTGVEINYSDEFDPDTEIKVEEQFSGKSFQLINSAYGEVNSKIYDIETSKDGVKVQPNGEITVRVPLPAEFKTDKVFVCYVDSVGGKVTKIPCEVKNGYVSFKTNHFSEYAIIEQPTNVKSVSINDISLNYKKSITLKPTIKADEGAKYTVKYESSNKKVATVDKNGKVTATKRGSGTAIITCTVTDSNGNVVKDTCKVNVKLSFGQILITYILFGWIWY